MKISFPRHPKTRYRFTLSILFMVLGIGFGSWASRIPDIQNALGLNDAELGAALFAAPLGQFPAMILSGLLVSRFGSRKILICGVIFYALSMAALGLAASFAQLFLALFLFGATANMFDNAVNTQAVSVEKLYRRSIMSTFHGMWSLGGVTGGIAGALLAGARVSTVVHFLFVAGASLCLLCVSFPGLVPRDLYRANKEAAAVRPAKKRRMFRFNAYIVMLGLIAFCSMGTEGAMYDWIAVYYTHVLHQPPSLARIGYIVCMACMVLGRFIADGLIIRFGEIRVLQGGGLFMSAGMGLLLGFPELIPASIGSGIVGFGMAAGVPICFSLAGKSQTIAPSIAIAMVTGISFWGFMLCPPFIGFLSHAFGLRAALAPIAGLGLIVLCIAPLAARFGVR